MTSPEGLAAGHARVIHQDVETAVAEPVEQRFHASGLHEVGPERDGGPALTLDLTHDGLRAVPRGGVMDDHQRPARGQTKGDCPSNSAAGPRDERDLALQLHDSHFLAFGVTRSPILGGRS
jgi:hypothetical protein